MFWLYLLAAGLNYEAEAAQNEISVFQSGGFLGIKVHLKDLPTEKLKKELKNGFTTTFLYRIKLNRGQLPLAAFEKISAVYYDLWDETFRLTQGSSSPQSANDSRAIKAVDQVLDQVAHVKFYPLIKMSEIDPASQYAVEASVFADPIQNDRIEHIHRWMAQNVVTAGDSGQTVSSQGPIRTSRLISTLMESYLKDGYASVRWKAEVRSNLFRAAEVKPE